MRVIWLVVGALAVAVGALWTLQGLNVVGGSGMSGNKIWAVIGPLLALVGLVLIVVGSRRRRVPR
jgi:hypothetical protein